MRSKILLLAIAAVVLAGSFIIYRAAVKHYHKRAAVEKKLQRPGRMASVREKVKAVPGAIKKFKQPKVAIVLDDFGYNVNNTDKLFSIKYPLTLSILPDLPYSTRIAELARENGREAILHLPLESHRSDVREETDTIRSGMSEKEIKDHLAAAIASVPGIKGVSNHMGSKSTEERGLMTLILEYLKAKDLYFLDSLTSERSVCRDVAAAAGERFARRDIFLDNSNEPAEIEKQMNALKKLAFKKGRVIAICHDRKNTVDVLARMMPELSKEGVSFVSLSELVRR